MFSLGELKGVSYQMANVISGTECTKMTNKHGWCLCNSLVLHSMIWKGLTVFDLCAFIGCCFPFPALTRCERTWGTSTHRECTKAGWTGPAGVHIVHLFSIPRALYSSATVSLWVTFTQHPRWRLPVLQTPEWWGALQQPAHWDAPCQAQLGVKTYWLSSRVCI